MFSDQVIITRKQITTLPLYLGWLVDNFLPYLKAQREEKGEGSIHSLRIPYQHYGLMGGNTKIRSRNGCWQIFKDTIERISSGRFSF